MLSRRTFMGSAAAALAACQPKADAPKLPTAQLRPGIAITIDDFNMSNGPMFSPAERNDKILDALAQHGVKAGAYPSGKYIQSDAEKAALSAWADAGHPIGNHSFSHGYYSGKDPDGMIADVLKAETVLSEYSTYEKRLRFPYLGEGKTAEGRDAFRALMAEHGYTNAHVTVDASDWYISDRLKKQLRANADVYLATYRDYYLTHLWHRASYYNDLAKDVTGRSDIPHTLLIHHNLINALFLGDVLEMFKSYGWRLVDIDEAYADPLYTESPKSLPAGQSLIWAMARADGGYEDRLRYPAEDGRYEKERMDKLGL